MDSELGSETRTQEHALPFLLILAIVVLIPLLFNPWGLNAFELPKTALLRSLAFAAVIILFFGVNPDSRTTNRRVFAAAWPGLLLIAIMALATAGSINRHTSLWGDYARQQGLIHWLALALFFVSLLMLLDRRARLNTLWRTLIWSSGPILIYAFVQASGLDPIAWRTDGASRVISTLGRSNFLGSYLVLVIPLTLADWLASDRPWSSGLLLVGQIIAMGLTLARGPWLGIGIGLMTFSIGWALLRDNRRLIVLILVTALLCFLMILFLNSDSEYAKPMLSLPGLDRLATLLDSDGGSVAARLTIWRTTFSLLSSRPWLGYGPDTMRLAFASVFPPELVYYQGRHIVVDRAHNLWLDTAVSAGLAGLTVLGTFLIHSGSAMVKGLRRSVGRRGQLMALALPAAFLGHLVDMQVSFEMAGSAVVFWSILAMGHAQLWTGAPTTLAGARQQRSSLSPFWAGGIVALSLTLFFILPVLADSVAHAAQTAELDSVRREKAAVLALRLWPYEPTYQVVAATVGAQRGDYAAAEEAFSSAVDKLPQDPQLWAAWGHFYAEWANEVPSQLQQAELAYRQALALSPNTAAYHTALGLVLARDGRYSPALAELQRAVDLDATDHVAYTHLAELYGALGKTDSAAWAHKQALYWQERTKNQLPAE